MYALMINDVNKISSHKFPLNTEETSRNRMNERTNERTTEQMNAENMKKTKN